MYITKETLAQALLDLKGTAHPLLKVWLTIKAMGLEADKPVLIDTKNSKEALRSLFNSGDPSGRFYIPFSPTPSDEWMKGDASRSIIQTTIKKWFDGTITTVDPRSYLTITKADKKYKIELAPSYPQGLGDGQNGFSRSDGQKLAVPIVQFAVWVFCREAIPDATANVAEYLCSKLRNLLHLSSAEESCVFKDTPFAISTSEEALTDTNVFELCGGLAGRSNINCGWCDEYLAAIRTKPFILLAGISGTGKSRIVRQLARGCCPEKKDGQPHPLRDEQKPGNYELIPVRPNWHDSTELMGYVTRITGTGKPKYVLTPFVKFLVKAWLHKDVPFFLCLDEMNLAPVEQYFAEYLSKIETRKLSGGDIVTDVLVEFTDEVCESAIEELLKPYKPAAGSPIPPEVTALENAMRGDKGIRIPSNLVVMGTVNMDETTCSFSRKVLDRAMSFELNDVEDMYTISEDGDPDVSWGAFNSGGVNRAKQTYVTAENLYAETEATKKTTNMAIGEKVLAYLKAINAVLDKTPFKVAYRTRNEMMLYCVERGGDLAKALDEVTSMKILSRIEGDENAVRVTNKLVESAAVVPTPIPNGAPKNLVQLLKRVILKQLGVVDGTVANAAAVPSAQEYETLEGKYKMCAAKLDEMNDRLLAGYTGFWR